MYVQPFPANGSKYQVPSDAINPVWSPSGEELISQSRGGMAAVSVTTQPTFAFGNPVEWPRPFSGRAPTQVRNWDVTPDGKRTLGIVAGALGAGGATAPQIQVVLNWIEELKARVPAK